MIKDTKSSVSNCGGFNMTIPSLTLLALTGHGCSLPLSLGWLESLWLVEHDPNNTNESLGPALRGLTASVWFFWSFNLPCKMSVHPDAEVLRLHEEGEGLN